MYFARACSPALFLLLASAATPAAFAGCSASGSAPEGRGDAPITPPAAGPLSDQFPEAAERVLGASRALVARADGSFGLAERAAELPIPHRGFHASLPRRGDAGVSFALHDGFSVRVREVGLAEEGRVEGRAVAYPRPGGTSYWAADDRGYEEWLHLDRGVAGADRPAAVWEVEGGVLVATPDGVDVTDATGRPRIHVAAKAAWTRSGRPLGPRLSARGPALELWVDAGGEAALVDPSWTNTLSMVTARGMHQATLLQDGRVLVAGGAKSPYGTALATCEIFDPTSAAWSLTGSMVNARSGFTATLLADGRVFAAGGDYNTTSSTELYAPSTGKWALGPAMSANRHRHTATLLQDGRVLLAGGYASTYLNGAQVFDPSTNTFTASSTMTSASGEHTATLLLDGRVLVAGGRTNGGSNWVYSAACQIYDPATNTWSATGSLPDARSAHAATLLPDGRVLLAGGTDSWGVNTYITEVWDPATGAWSYGPPMAHERNQFPLVPLFGAQFMAVGGERLGGTLGIIADNRTEIYDAAAGTWAAGATMNTARCLHQATRLADQTLLATGGFDNSYNGGATWSAEIYIIPTLANGAGCTSAARCFSGYCVDGVCCNSPCGAGPCDACSVAAGAVADGVCTNVNGVACSDGNACTGGDVCVSGACVGQSTIDCGPAPDACHDAPVCVPATGTCTVAAIKPNGTACNDGKACTTNDTCQNGACTGTAIVCPAPGACQYAVVCDPSTGLCPAPTSKPDGTACSDGNACTLGDTCQGGVCKGQSSVVCPLPDQCHTAGTCNPTTGTCSNPIKANGAACEDGNPCTSNDTCQNGACQAGSAVVCTAPDACHLPGNCDPKTGACVNAPTKADGTACSDGNACTSGDACQAGVCTPTSSITCAPPDQCHQPGTCNPATGTCTYAAKPDGTACDDGNACTVSDACQSGTCNGTALSCPPAGACQIAGVCNSATGICAYAAQADGSACDDGDACTTHDTCQSGTCKGGPAVTCPAPDPCHLPGTCDPTSGCSNQAKADGSACDDGDACTVGDGCQGGVCTGGPLVVCPPPSACQDPGVCNPASGQCAYPAKADGTTCDDGDPCTENEACTGGACAGGTAVTCTAPDACHEAGSCDSAHGGCQIQAKPDGTPCAGGQCVAGTCTPADAGSDDDAGTQDAGPQDAGAPDAGAPDAGAPDAGAPDAGAPDAGAPDAGASSPDTTAGCGCEVRGRPDVGGSWLGLALLLLARRRPGRPRR
jgi:hypothetical protein